MENIEKELYQAAIELVNMRYPSGWGGAASTAFYISDKYDYSLVSVSYTHLTLPTINWV